MQDLTRIQRPKSDCGKPIIRLEAYSSCNDEGGYYGTGSPTSGSNGVQPFAYRRVTNIRGFVSRVPRTIERIVSQNCRTQKTTSSRIWQIQGADLYPVWKMDEIETMLQSEHITIDGEDVVYRAAEPAFTLAYNSCTGLFTLRINVEECTIQNIYGCGESCEQFYYVLAIPIALPLDDNGNVNFFTDGASLIGNDITSLMQYLRNQTGVTDVQDLTGVISLNCSFYAIISISGINPVLPPYFYINYPSVKNKVWLRKLNVVNPDYDSLCNNINTTKCKALHIGTPTIIALTCSDVILDTPIVTLFGGNCWVDPVPYWEQYSGVTSIVGGYGTNTLNLSLFNQNLPIAVSDLTGQYDYTAGSSGACSVLIPNGQGAIIDLVEIKGSPTSDYNFNQSTGVIDFTGFTCLGASDFVHIEYHFPAGIGQVLSGQVIAEIKGGCLPTNTTYVTHSINPSIPDGSTLIIGTDGKIRWVGRVTTSDNTGSVIEVTNIVYQTL